jgi:hypothetical protein
MQFRPGVQRARKCLGLVITITSAGGCTPVPDQALHTVDEYRRNLSLRALTLTHCAQDPVSRDLKPDCLNAREAERLESVGSLRQLAPLNLPIPKAPSNATSADSRPRN